MSHDYMGQNEKLAMRVIEEARRGLKGIGQAMASIALNHIAAEGINRLYLHNVIALGFFLGLSKGARVVEVNHEDRGPIDLSEAESEDVDVEINMVISTKNEHNLPRISISSRQKRGLFNQPCL
ncbi:MAG: hypothetical protein JW782_04350 [Candidatus Saganbacteria bacterium]|nr:hypothetical protein [Candidatus Saganbacteria bacterium]